MMRKMSSQKDKSQTANSTQSLRKTVMEKSDQKQQELTLENINHHVSFNINEANDSNMPLTAKKTNESAPTKGMFSSKSKEKLNYS